MTRTGANVDHDDSRARRRREAEHLTKIAVEHNNSSFLSNGDFEHGLIGCSLEPLVPNRRRIVSCRAEQLGDAAAQIFVELEPHSAVTGTKRTRAASAP